MPDKYGKLSVDAVSDLPNLDLCPAVDKANGTVTQMQNQIDAISAKMNDMPIGSPLRDKAAKDIGVLYDLRKQTPHDLRWNLSGYAQVTFANNSFEERKNEFLIMNQDMVINNRVNLLQMPVKERLFDLPCGSTCGRSSHEGRSRSLTSRSWSAQRRWRRGSEEHLYERIRIGATRFEPLRLVRKAPSGLEA